jgi:hypothetical protein
MNDSSRLDCPLARRLLPGLLTLAVAVALPLGPRTARADDATYEIRKFSAPATAGAPSTVSVTVVGKNGWHVNDEAPITATVKADPGIALPKAKLTRADLAESTKQSARFDIPFSAAEAGPKTITAQTRFVMCQEQACKPASETIAFNVEVQPTAAPGTPSAPSRAKHDGKAAVTGKKTAPHTATP